MVLMCPTFLDGLSIMTIFTIDSRSIESIKPLSDDSPTDIWVWPGLAEKIAGSTKVSSPILRSVSSPMFESLGWTSYLGVCTQKNTCKLSWEPKGTPPMPPPPGNKALLRDY